MGSVVSFSSAPATSKPKQAVKSSKCLDHNARRRVGKGGENAARMEPADAELAENVVPVDVARLQLRRGGMAAVGAADRAADAEATLREIQAVADRAADAVERNPFDERRVDAALHDEIFDETADWIVGERRDDGGAFAEAFAEAAGDVVFAAAFPDVEGARRMDAAFAWIEAEHDFTEGDDIVAAGFGGFRFHDEMVFLLIKDVARSSCLHHGVAEADRFRPTAGTPSLHLVI